MAILACQMNNGSVPVYFIKIQILTSNIFDFVIKISMYIYDIKVFQAKAWVIFLADPSC